MEPGLARARRRCDEGHAAGQPFRQGRPPLDRQDVLVEDRAHLLEGLAEHQAIANPFEHVAELAVVQHQAIVRVPERKTFGHRFGRLNQAISRRLQRLHAVGHAIDHAVERAADARDLVATGDLDPDRGIACGNPVGGIGQALQAARQHEAHAEADQRDQDHPGHGDLDAEIARLPIGVLDRTVRELDRERAHSDLRGSRISTLRQ